MMSPSPSSWEVTLFMFEASVVLNSFPGKSFLLHAVRWMFLKPFKNRRLRLKLTGTHLSSSTLSPLHPLSILDWALMLPRDQASIRFAGFHVVGRS